MGYKQYNRVDVGTEPWVFLSPETVAVFNKIKSGNTVSLKSIAEISVGLQTSADKIYIFELEEETKTTFLFTNNDIQWEIEKDICCHWIYDLS